MGGGGGRTQTSTTETTLAPELRPLYAASGQRVTELQQQAPLSEFLAERPATIPGLSPTQERAFQLAPGLGAQPAQEQVALERAGALPSVAGRVPAGFQGFGASGPAAGQTALRFAAASPTIGSRVPGEFFTAAGRPGVENLALSDILRLPGVAGRTPAEFEQLQRRTPEERLALSDILRLPGVAGRTPTGEGIERAPAIQAAQRAFEATVSPRIISELTLSGLGRSTAVPQALALAESQYLPGFIEAELGRQERGIGRESEAIQFGIPALERLGGASAERLAALAAARERGIGREAGAVGAGIPALERLGGAETSRLLNLAGAEERGIGRTQAGAEFAAPLFFQSGQAETERRLSELGAEERGIQREAGAAQAAIPAFLQAGAAETGRRGAELQATTGLGELERGVSQEESAAAEAERLRLQALAEQALFIPFGQLLPAAFGQRTATRGGGGAFK